MAEAALNIITEIGWTKEYIMGLNINFIASLHLAIQRKTLLRLGIVPDQGKKAPQKRTQAAKQDDRWASRRWEEKLGNGKVRVHNRVNVNDLWNNPGLLNSALSGK